MPALMRMLAAATWLQLTRPLTSGDVDVAPPDASQVVPYFEQFITCPGPPGRLRALWRLAFSYIEIGYVWDFCMGAQGAL
jgi:hypothetical protein